MKKGDIFYIWKRRPSAGVGLPLIWKAEYIKTNIKKDSSVWFMFRPINDDYLVPILEIQKDIYVFTKYDIWKKVFR